ncbi:hypothetical protein [Dichotomicrobium thermohalophilum]|nr:hypothetical protein [Dichotomicrobium thermohalophilum]
MAKSWSYGERDYRAIEDALMGSDYGRWFLGEYLARNRSEETQRLLEALDRLEDSLGAGVNADRLPRLREIALEIDAALGDALARIEPETTVPSLEPPVETILEAVEDINSFLESLTARRVYQRLSEKIRARLADIQASCAQVDSRSEAAQTLTQVLSDLRARLSAVDVGLEAPDLSNDGDGPRFPRKLLEELAAAFGPGRSAPARG